MGVMNKFIELSWKEKKILGEAIVFLFLTKAVLIIFPFKTCLKLLPPIKNENPLDLELLNQIKFNIARANRLAFWENQCLVKSLAVRLMLQLRGIPSKLSLGMMMNERNEPIAHAWIKAGEIEIVGKDRDFLELFSV